MTASTSSPFDLLDDLGALRRLPNTVRTVIAEAAQNLGIDVLPRIYAIVRKDAEGKWELVAVALDPSLLPAMVAGEFRVSAQLDFNR